MAKYKSRRREGLGYTYHVDECPKRRGSISGCICRDDEHAEATRELRQWCPECDREMTQEEVNSGIWCFACKEPPTPTQEEPKP